VQPTDITNESGTYTADFSGTSPLESPWHCHRSGWRVRHRGDRDDRDVTTGTGILGLTSIS
jgi:hypothetical protein